MRSAVFLAAILLCLSACGGSSGGTPEIGWKTHHVDDGGFSIETPAAWVTLEKFDEQGVDEFVQDNPQYAGIKQAVEAGLIKFLAGDPDRSNGFATNVNVVVHSLGRPMTLSAYERALVAAQRQAFRGASVQSGQVELPAGRCVRLTGAYPVRMGDAQRTLAVRQYACLRNQTEYVVTFTTPEDQRARYRTAFARSARSLRID